MRNTVRAIGEGLVEWGKQGSHFCATAADPRARPLDEQLLLHDLYSHAVHSDSAHAVVAATLERDARRCDAIGASRGGDAAAAAIEQRVCQFGSDVFLVVSGLDEECERELECDELERETETQVPRRDPATPTPWQFKGVFDPRTASPGFVPTALDAAAGVTHLSHAFATRYRPSLRAIQWDKSSVYVTRNFVETVVERGGAPLDGLTDYMRPVDALVVFPASRSCLLVSEWEADALLRLAWDQQALATSGACFVNAAYLLRASNAGWDSARAALAVPQHAAAESNRHKMPRTAAALLCECTLAALQLLAGDTMFCTDARKAAVAELLPSDEARSAAWELVQVRGRGHIFVRSDLELLCGDVQRGMHASG